MLSPVEIEKIFKTLYLEEKLEETTIPDLSAFYLKEEGLDAWFVADNITTIEKDRGT